VDTFNKRLACAILALAPFSSTTANATYLYNNIDVSSGGTAHASTSGSGPLGNSFSTGPSGYTLTAVDLLVLVDNPSDGGSFTVSLLNDSSIHPGSTIATDTFHDSMLSTSLSTLSAPFSSMALAADTRYWIELSTSTGSLEWAYTAANDGIGVANEYNFSAGSVSANQAFTPYQMRIGSAVPEPSTWALMLAGIRRTGFCRCSHTKRVGRGWGRRATALGLKLLGSRGLAKGGDRRSGANGHRGGPVGRCRHSYVLLSFNYISCRIGIIHWRLSVSSCRKMNLTH